ncbi:MAG TPA: proton-conducting transporter membrane subunit [Candidatus Ozemobacteraceae bacterium]|nr:proton-conducting transporter membrane subunit [Candidatus Ozemobacteraceae bacterium]
MFMILGSLGLLAITAIVSLLIGQHVRACSVFSAAMATLAAGLGILPCLSVLAGQAPLTFLAPWEIPLGSFALRLDGLSAFFLLPIFGLSALTAVYGSTYIPHAIDTKNLGVAWSCFHLLSASMVTVVLAANSLLFLLAWELTVLSSFILVVLGNDSESNRRAGWIYLTASHLGTGFLIVLFLLMGRETGSLDFAGFSRIASLSTGFKGTLFLLAVIGFGTKAGFLPLHVWLPEAHPAAPSHVSALMSGVMIKTGIYGLVRVIFFLGHPDPWWGWTLLIIGLVSGILGVLFALSQHDLKRLLAYHSVENIGIIALGLGLGLIGLSHGQMSVAVFGLAGGLLHVLNHAVFKGLLFLGAGAVLEQTGTRDIDRLGGLLKRMPWTGGSFLIGCLSISGLPPFNGFISEFLIYMGALLAVMGTVQPLVVAGLLIIVGLSLIGGLAAACFAKAFSVVFLGNPREGCATSAHEVGLPMRLPMVLLAALCALIALAAPFGLEPLAVVLSGHPDLPPAAELLRSLARADTPLAAIVWGSFLLLALLGGVLAWRRHLLSGREIGRTGTWDCGYAQPAVNMQYTGSSFAQPLVDLFQPVLKTETHLGGVDGYFPRHATFSSHTADLFMERLFGPIFRGIAAVLHRVIALQSGVVQAYVLYITITLVILLIGGLL